MQIFRPLILKFGRYLIVGALNTALNFLLMSIGAFLGWHYLLYTFFGYAMTIILSFFMNLRFTFKVADNQWQRLLGFLSVSLFNLLVVEGIEYVLIENVGMSRWLAIVIGMGWYVVAGFLANNYLVYRQWPVKYRSAI